LGYGQSIIFSHFPDTFLGIVNLISIDRRFVRIMMRWVIGFFLCVFVLALISSLPLRISGLGPQHSLAAAKAPTPPVILELFTSEGCSSCPPADALLKKLDDAGRVDNAEIIAIEEHVDYWDRLGWTDPFSSSDWTRRQERYSEAFRRGGIYTPQLVVNGRAELVGSSERQVRQEILEAGKISAATVRVSSISLTSNSAELTIALVNLPSEARFAELWLAVTERGLSSNVLRGENEGRTLVHAAVLRSLSRVRSTALDPSVSAELKTTVTNSKTWKRENLRFVVFLQEPKSLHILGAAASSASH